jgi:hypothetical protein
LKIVAQVPLTQPPKTDCASLNASSTLSKIFVPAALKSDQLNMIRTPVHSRTFWACADVTAKVKNPKKTSPQQ